MTKTEAVTSHPTEQIYTSFLTTQVVSTPLQTTITTLPNTIQTTIPTTIALTESSNTVKITETDNYIEPKPIKFILLGYSHFIKRPTYFSFYTYLVPFEGKYIPKYYRYRLTLVYYSLRQLQTKVERWENCTFGGLETDVKLKYFCRVDAEMDETTKIQIDPDFQFDRNISITSSTISLVYMDNIQNIPEEFDALMNSTIYMLLHSQKNVKNQKVLNISGVIEGPKPNFQKNMDLSLIITQETNRTELDCTIADITGNNYTLNCKTDKNLEGTILQNSISFFEEESILLVNFDSLQDSTIEATNSTYIARKFYFKNNSGISAGAIVAIVLAFVAALSAIIIATYFLRNKKSYNEIDNSSRIKITGNNYIGNV